MSTQKKTPGVDAGGCAAEDRGGRLGGMNYSTREQSSPECGSLVKGLVSPDLKVHTCRGVSPRGRTGVLSPVEAETEHLGDLRVNTEAIRGGRQSEWLFTQPTKAMPTPPAWRRRVKPRQRRGS